MRRYDAYDRDLGPGPGRRGRGYAADYPRGYDRGYDRGWRAGPGPSFAGASFPMGPGYMPLAWGWYGPFGMEAEPFPYGPPFLPAGPRADERPPRRPEESPAYGRGGDRELLRWARERGYDVGYTLYPRDRRRDW